jgi:hypothetical protein
MGRRAWGGEHGAESMGRRAWGEEHGKEREYGTLKLEHAPGYLKIPILTLCLLRVTLPKKLGKGVKQ